MRVVLDINGITETSGGLGNYIRLLVSNLAAIDAENEYLLYLHQWKSPDPAALDRVLPKQANFKLVFRRVPNTLSLFAEYKWGIGLTDVLLKGGPKTVFHGPSNVVPRLGTMKSLVSIHHYMPTTDPVLFPKKMDARSRFYFGLTDAVARQADRIVVVSKTTGNHLVERLGISREKVSVVYPGGPHPVYRRIEEPLPSPLAEKLQGPYILFPGPLNERKNLPGFLEAFASVQNQLEGYRIAVTSTPSESFAATIAATVEKFSLSGKVVFLGEVSDADMAALYSHAACLAYPSFFEGFGSPPLEAMACGCPVMASNLTAIPEITAGAALLFDPADKASMSQALLRIVREEALRRDLIARGFERVKNFSWRRMAQEIHGIYGEMAGDRS